MPGRVFPSYGNPLSRIYSFWTANMPIDEHYLFDLEEDPTEENNLVGTQREQ